jgi:NAD(P)-dependent dehydrogenase (short-subunit alcohol dehydrogenase family)
VNDLFSLKGKNAVVVGGAGGIGHGIAEGLARYGARVTLADINHSALEQAAADIQAATGSQAAIKVVDCSQESSVQELVASTVADMGRVHILVNAQGYNAKAPATEFPMEEWDKLFSVNIRGVMMCCKHFAAHMAEQGGGKIINLSSIRGARGATGGNLAYCASKGAVNMLTKQLACELAPKNVLVNAIAPIITITPMTEERIKAEASRYERMLLNVPMGRMGTVGDLVGPAVFLAAPASDFVTGTILYPDGGMSSFV